MQQHTVRQKTQSSEARFSPTVDAMRAALAAFDVAPAEPREVAEAQAFAAVLIGGKLVSSERLASVHESTGAGLFLFREQGELTGLLALVLLSAEGLAAVRADAFDSLDPAPAHVIVPGGEPVGIYGWGIAATNHEAAAKILDACGLLGRTVAPHLPVYARPVTPKGVRLMMERLNFRPVPGSTTGLVWFDPATARPEAVAA